MLWFPFKIGRAICAMFLMVLLLTASLPASATRVRRQATAGHYNRHRRSKKSHKVQGQKAIDPQRAAEIQEALIREHYLRGNATGSWDASSEAAMQKFQLDNGWQTKIIPDARALIKLGLGPKQDAGEYASSTSLTHSLSSPVAPATTLPQ